MLSLLFFVVASAAATTLFPMPSLLMSASIALWPGHQQQGRFSPLWVRFRARISEPGAWKAELLIDNVLVDVLRGNRAEVRGKLNADDVHPGRRNLKVRIVSKLSSAVLAERDEMIDIVDQNQAARGELFYCSPSEIMNQAAVMLHGVAVYPISFASLPQYVVRHVSYDKTVLTAVIVPPHAVWGTQKVYEFGPLEEDMYRQAYRDSFFGLTRKKAGWDCNRHYEILAAGSVPYFTDVDEMPENVATFLPRDILSDVLKMPGISFEGWNYGANLRPSLVLDAEHFNLTRYYEVANKLLRRTQCSLTTVAMAKYVLKVTGNENARSMLFISLTDRMDYLGTHLFHGFRSLLGTGCVDVKKLSVMYKFPSDMDSADQLLQRAMSYGFGYGYAFTLDNIPVNRENISTRIQEKEFDVIVYGNIHRSCKNWVPQIDSFNCKRELWMWGEISANYPKNKIVMLDGQDLHHCTMVKRYGEKATIFLRELLDLSNDSSAHVW